MEKILEHGCGAPEVGQLASEKLDLIVAFSTTCCLPRYKSQRFQSFLAGDPVGAGSPRAWRALADGPLESDAQ
jgi:hypothetical protein